MVTCSGRIEVRLDCPEWVLATVSATLVSDYTEKEDRLSMYVFAGVIEGVDISEKQILEVLDAVAPYAIEGSTLECFSSFEEICCWKFHEDEWRKHVGEIKYQRSWESFKAVQKAVREEEEALTDYMRGREIALPNRSNVGEIDAYMYNIDSFFDEMGFMPFS